MTTAQKVIKYLAVAFALFLVCSIISGIAFGIYGLGVKLGILNSASNSETDGAPTIQPETSFSYSDSIDRIDIDLSFSNLNIVTGETLEVMTNNKSVTVNKHDGTLKISEKSKGKLFSSLNFDSNVTLSIPTDILYKSVKISTGAGEISIDGIVTNKFELDLGAGDVQVKNVTVKGEANIDGGAGNATVLSSTLSNLDLDLGIGNFTLEAILSGENSIDSGVGNIQIKLIDGLDNYEFDVSKGLGSITIGQNEFKSDTSFGNGETFIEIDGGIGNISIE